jgi:hypothetical protein
MLAFASWFFLLGPFGLGVLFGCVYCCMNFVLAFQQVEFIQQRDLRIALWGWGLGCLGIVWWVGAQLLGGVWLMLFALLSSYVLEYGFKALTEYSGEKFKRD